MYDTDKESGINTLEFQWTKLAPDTIFFDFNRKMSSLLRSCDQENKTIAKTFNGISHTIFLPFSSDLQES